MDSLKTSLLLIGIVILAGAFAGEPLAEEIGFTDPKLGKALLVVGAIVIGIAMMVAHILTSVGVGKKKNNE
jgi:hypothetical protein